MNIVITGGGRGIGKAIVEKFVNENCKVFFCCLSQASLEKVLATYKKSEKQKNLFGMHCDISNALAAENFFYFVQKHTSHIDILVNNVGVFLPGSVEEGEPKNLDILLKKNLFSALYTTQFFLPLMKKSKCGHILFMNSIAGIESYPNGMFYGITKYALKGLSDNLRESLRKEKIKVTDIFPGPVYTDSWAGSGLDAKDFIQAEDIANNIWAICNNSASSSVEQLILRPLPF